MRCLPCDRKWQGGAAMVVALLILALSAALVVAMQDDFNRYYLRTANLLLAEQGQAYLRGAEQLAGMALKADWDRDKQAGRPRDDLTELWAQKAQPYALDDGGWLLGSLEDLQGRFNLNALAQKAGGQEQGEQGQSQPGERLTPAQQQFVRLLQALGEPQLSIPEAVAITRAVGDWLDADQEVSPDGAEDDYYAGGDPAWRTANQPMASASELRAVANVTPQLYRALEPYVTAWPREPQTLNIHTAPATLLRTLNGDGDLSPLSEGEADALVQYREENGFLDKADLLAQPVFADKQLGGLGDRLGESSNYFLLRAEVKVADRNLRLYSVLERRNRDVNTLVRTSGSL